MNNNLELKHLFHNLKNESYVLIKCPEYFPKMNYGDDLDFFCRNIKHVSEIIINSLEQNLSDKEKILINKKRNKIHIDYIKESKILLRFDLINSLEGYKSINLKPSLFDVIIENSKDISKNGIIIKVPSIEDEYILRYIEYLEYFAKVPDKLKHIDYILDNLKDEEEKNRFFSKLHYFINIPYPVFKPKSLSEKLIDKRDYLIDLFKKSHHELKHNGIKSLLIKIFKKW